MSHEGTPFLTSPVIEHNTPSAPLVNTIARMPKHRLRAALATNSQLSVSSAGVRLLDPLVPRSLYPIQFTSDLWHPASEI
jgi:hypothetical protein